MSKAVSYILRGDQCRAARALLDLTQLELAKAAHVETKTITAFEHGVHIPRDTTLNRLRAALAVYGITFIEDEEGIGVRRRRTVEEIEVWEALRKRHEAEALSAQMRFPTALTPRQSRAARGLLSWKQAELADAAGISTGTVQEFEGEKRTLQPGTMQRILLAFSNAGVAFIGSNGVEFPSSSGNRDG